MQEVNASFVAYAFLVEVSGQTTYIFDFILYPSDKCTTALSHQMEQAFRIAESTQEA